LKRDDEKKLEYRKNTKYHNFNLQNFINLLLGESKAQLEKDEAEGEEEEEDESDNQSNSSYNSGDSKSDKKKKAEVLKPLFKDSNFTVTDNDLVGPSLVDFTKDPNHVVAEEEQIEFFDETMKMLHDQHKQAEEFKGEVEDTIANIFGDADHKKKKKKSNKAIYLGAEEEELTEEQEKERQKSHKKFMESYHDQFGGKTLLQEHESRKRDQKFKAKNSGYRSFDREKDMQGIASKDAFKALYSNNEMDSRFDTSGSKFL